jgi:hypothetical protein
MTRLDRIFGSRSVCRVRPARHVLRTVAYESGGSAGEFQREPGPAGSADGDDCPFRPGFRSRVVGRRQPVDPAAGIPVGTSAGAPVSSSAGFPSDRTGPDGQSQKRYLFTDESGGTYSRTQLVLISGAGQLASGPERLSSGTRKAFLRDPDGPPPGSGRPSVGARTAFLRGPDGFPLESDWPSFRSRAVFLQLQDRLPPWPGRPTRERIPETELSHVP